jgi:hypothetical protein
MLNGLTHHPGRAERHVYLAVIAVLTLCLLAVMGQSYRSTRHYERRLAALRRWQRESVDASNDLHHRAAAAVDRTPEADWAYPRRDDDAAPPAPVCAADYAEGVIDELSRENEQLRERPDLRPRSTLGGGGEVCTGFCGPGAEQIAKQLHLVPAR